MIYRKNSLLEASTHRKDGFTETNDSSKIVPTKSWMDESDSGGRTSTSEWECLWRQTAADGFNFSRSTVDKILLPGFHRRSDCPIWWSYKPQPDVIILTTSGRNDAGIWINPFKKMTNHEWDWSDSFHFILSVNVFLTEISHFFFQIFLFWRIDDVILRNNLNQSCNNSATRVLGAREACYQ